MGAVRVLGGSGTKSGVGGEAVENANGSVPPVALAVVNICKRVPRAPSAADDMDRASGLGVV